MKLRYRVLTFLAVMLVAGCLSYADPKIRGSLFDTDVLRIPDRYHGLWATPRDACGVSRDYGVQILINETSIGNTNVLRVQGYSDDTAVMIDLNEIYSPTATRMLFLELSNSGNSLRVTDMADKKITALRRCPWRLLK